MADLLLGSGAGRFMANPVQSLTRRFGKHCSTSSIKRKSPVVEGRGSALFCRSAEPLPRRS